jgi:hypothetical protein
MVIRKSNEIKYGVVKQGAIYLSKGLSVRSS